MKNKLLLSPRSDDMLKTAENSFVTSNCANVASGIAIAYKIDVNGDTGECGGNIAAATDETGRSGGVT
jgi:hypothetical protein